ncbi:MAG: DUF6159 family protein [Chloroflexi bacterium]|nr:DUF6159 family protein [Chloroflexota bacterium]
MFGTIGHTFELIKMSWAVLMKDKELLWFPVFSAMGVGAVIGLFFAIGSATGAIDRLSETSTDANGQATSAIQGGDIVLAVIAFFLVYFVTIFFSAALVSAALERLRGGDPDVRSGLRHAFAHIFPILGWAIITASVSLILQIAKANQKNAFGRIVLDIVGGIWEFLTFFVVPVLVSESVGPFGAIKRSTELVRKTWGRQITASFGFFIVYIIAIGIAVIPAVLLGLIIPIAGIVTGLVTVALALAIVQSLEGIFKAALYEYAMGERPQEFDLRTLQTAYRAVPEGQ